MSFTKNLKFQIIMNFYTTEMYKNRHVSGVLKWEEKFWQFSTCLLLPVVLMISIFFQRKVNVKKVDQSHVELKSLGTERLVCEVWVIASPELNWPTYNLTLPRSRSSPAASLSWFKLVQAHHCTLVNWMATNRLINYWNWERE